MNKICILFLFFTIPVIILGHPSDSITSDVEKGIYIENLDKYLSLKLSINNNIEFFEVHSDPLDFKLRPNTKLKTSLSVNYRFISFALTVSPDFLPGNNDDDRKGSSKIRSLGVGLNFNHWIQGLSYNRTNGFYLQNTSDFVPDWNKDTSGYLLSPELQYLGFYGLTAYKFNANFSLKSLTSQTERQLKSAGSLIPLFWYRYYIMDNKIELTGQNSSQKSNNLEVILQLGYYYTHVINSKLYLSAGTGFGGGMVYTRLLSRLPEGDVVTRGNNPILRAEGQLAMGYNSKRFFAGLQATGRWEKYSQGNTTTSIVNDAVSFQIFIGYRFKAPGASDRLLDKIQDKAKIN